MKIDYEAARQLVMVMKGRGLVSDPVEPPNDRAWQIYHLNRLREWRQRRREAKKVEVMA
jgi:hypothetical protein